MTKILVISDSHGHTDLFQECINLNSDIDILIHCGDGLIDLKRCSIPSGIDKIYVAGNIDLQSAMFLDEASIATETICGKNIMITHGHNYHVKSGLHLLKKEALKIKADVVFFGHTHIQEYIDEGIKLFNPGNLSSRYYGIITIENSHWDFAHKRL